MNYTLGLLFALGSLYLLFSLESNSITASETEDLRSFWELLKNEISNPNEAWYRFTILRERAALIRKHNQSGSSWKKRLNKFSHLSDQERSNILQEKVPDVSSPKNLLQNGSFIASDFLKLGVANKINWIDKGCVSKIKNQQACHCSYAFATTAAVESAFLINNRNVTISEQEIIDCSKDDGNQGCTSGSIISSLQYIQTKSISLDADYAYNGIQAECKAASFTSKSTIKGFKTLEPNINSLLKNLPIAPIAAALYIKDDFLDYENGIYDAEGSCGSINQTNGAVLIVGYNLEDSIPYIIVKNSWGSKWGEEGFARMAIGQRSTGPCFIAGSSNIAFPSI